MKRLQKFSFERNLKGRLLLQRIERHISQAECKYDLFSSVAGQYSLFIPPAPDAAFWIVERLLVQLESEFDRARRARRKKRAA